MLLLNRQASEMLPLNIRRHDVYRRMSPYYAYHAVHRAVDVAYLLCHQSINKHHDDTDTAAIEQLPAIFFSALRYFFQLSFQSLYAERLCCRPSIVMLSYCHGLLLRYAAP